MKGGVSRVGMDRLSLRNRRHAGRIKDVESYREQNQRGGALRATPLFSFENDDAAKGSCTGLQNR